MLTRRQLLVLFALLLYWPAIFIATHIPHFPKWATQVSVSDKTMHFIAYFLLAFLFWYVIKPNSKVNWRKPAAWLVLLVLGLYGVIDEWLQMYVGRSADVRDFIADMAGVITALILLTLFHFWPACLILTGSYIFIMTNFLRSNAGLPISPLEIGLYFSAYSFFSLLWMRYIHHFLPVRPPQIRWLIGAAALPILVLLGFELFCVMAGNGLHHQALIVSLAGIAIASALIFVYGLIADKEGQ